jgi:hypothetical protein
MFRSKYVARAVVGVAAAMFSIAWTLQKIARAISPEEG